MSAESYSFRLNYRVANTSAHALVVKMKGGLSYLIRASREVTMTQEHLVYVSIMNAYLDDIRIDESQALTKLDRRILAALAKEHESFTKGPNYFSEMPVNLETCITLGQSLIEDNNAIHSELLGITLYIGANGLNQPALKTPAMTLKELFNRCDLDREPEGLHFIAYVNDPKRISQTYYTNVRGQALPIPVSANNDKDPGLYVAVSRGNEPRENKYYTFDDLNANPKILEAVGVFESKSACEKGSNTERVLLAEDRNKKLSKDNGQLVNQVSDLESSIQKLQEMNEKLADELSRTRHEHKTELIQLKHTHQMTSEMSKYESRLAATINKANFDMVKNKASQSTWGDFAKAVGTLAGVAFTGYKLLTT